MKHPFIPDGRYFVQAGSVHGKIQLSTRLAWPLSSAVCTIRGAKLSGDLEKEAAASHADLYAKIGRSRPRGA